MALAANARETSRWLRDSSAALDQDLTATRRKTLYRVGDLLWKHRAALREGLLDRERNLLNRSDTIVFYDLSNAHCTGHHGDNGLDQFGRSKQKRNDCPLVT